MLSSASFFSCALSLHRTERSSILRVGPKGLGPGLPPTDGLYYCTLYILFLAQVDARDCCK